ncbi:MAG: hypothetical protein QM750_19000 [Rubrivivax sp.]
MDAGTQRHPTHVVQALAAVEIQAQAGDVALALDQPAQHRHVFAALHRHQLVQPVSGVLQALVELGQLAQQFAGRQLGIGFDALDRTPQPRPHGA